MSAQEKIFATVEYIGKTDTVVCGAFGTYPMDESVEFTRTDLSQAAVAAALESAAVIAETHQVYQAHVCAARIRALITPDQHDALAAHVAAGVAKARAEIYAQIEAMPRREELLGGQRTEYIQLHEALAWIGAKP